jgi:uncharacterized protein (UPF0261 family)
MARIAISSDPVISTGNDCLTATCVTAARLFLEHRGCEVETFPASGAGGRELESAIAAGRFAGVLDVSLCELAAEVPGGPLSAGADRLTAAAMHAVPQVIVPGAVDAVVFPSRDSVPPEFRGRRLAALGRTMTAMRTTPQENDRIGREIALKASASRAMAVVALPLRGISALDRDGMPFWWPDADAALFQSIRNWISPAVRLVEFDEHLNDPSFARSVAMLLLETMDNLRNH